MPSRKSVPAGCVPDSVGAPSWICCSIWIGSRIEQFNLLSGASPWPEWRCKIVAYTSFPVPLSPRINTGISVRAMSRTVAFSDSMSFPCPTTKWGSAKSSMVLVGLFMPSFQQVREWNSVGPLRERKIQIRDQLVQLPDHKDGSELII